jgi:hypothetical protein
MGLMRNNSVIIHDHAGVRQSSVGISTHAPPTHTPTHAHAQAAGAHAHAQARTGAHRGDGGTPWGVSPSRSASQVAKESLSAPEYPPKQGYPIFLPNYLFHRLSTALSNLTILLSVCPVCLVKPLFPRFQGKFPQNLYKLLILFNTGKGYLNFRCPLQGVSVVVVVLLSLGGIVKGGEFFCL